MANERKTVVTFKGNGTQKTFAFPFDYLKKSYIKVMFDGVVQEYGVAYTIYQKQVDFAAAPSADVVIVIFRETATDRLVAWEDASVLRASDMTVNQVQQLHIAEETVDKVQDSGMARDDYDNIWDARYTRIKNVENPVDAQDVVTKKYFESVQAGYIKANNVIKDEATRQQGIATTKAQEASTSAANALASENKAKNSENNAKTSETNAKTSENAAKTSETNAIAAVVTATSKAAEATTEANRSKSEADRAQTLTNGVIVPAPSIPPGIPFPWFTDVFPAGTLECNGQSFNTTSYPELTKVYPSGVLPDLRGVTLRGLDSGRGLDIDGIGRAVGSYQADNYKTHRHNATLDGVAGTNNQFQSQIGLTTYSTVNGGYESAYARGVAATTEANASLTSSSGGSETRMKNVACYWLVYTKAVYYDTAVEGGNALTLGGYPVNYFAVKSESLPINAPNTRVWVSPVFKFSAVGTPVVMNHDLHLNPMTASAEVIAICTVASNGYAVGEVINNPHGTPQGTYVVPFHVTMTADTCSVNTTNSTALYLRNKDTNVYSTVPVANFNLAIRIRY